MNISNIRIIRITTLVVIFVAAFASMGAWGQTVSVLPQGEWAGNHPYAALSRVMPAERVQRLQPVARIVEGRTSDNAHLTTAQRTHTFTHISVLNDAEAGFAVVRGEGADAEVLAYGDHAIDPDNVPPAFAFLMELYEQGGVQTASGANGPQSPRNQSMPKRVNYANVPSLLASSWNQSSPYNNACPLYQGNGSRCLTGCVATSMAQVLRKWKPTRMRGYKKYGYTTDDGQHMTYDLDFAHTTLDWAGMLDSYHNWIGSETGTAAQKNAVAQLMYVCGVATSMYYHTSSSRADTYVGAEAINNMMEGVSAEMMAFDEQTVVTELQNGRPVIYGGVNSKGVGHSFVIDGVRSDGRFLCNMGWGGSGDGAYAASDMNGYAYLRHDMMLVRPWDAPRPVYTPLPELREKYVSARRHSSATIEEGRWYVLWNTQDASSPYTDGPEAAVKIRRMLPSGEPSTDNAGQLVRFVRADGGDWFIQTGTGEYIGQLTPYAAADVVTTASPEARFTIGTTSVGNFWLRNNDCNLDVRSATHRLVGYSMKTPDKSVGSDVWQLYPVAISDQPITHPDDVPDVPYFSPDKFYTLRNTGYSQGYLVALSPSDAHPTLRGVTQDHPTQGLKEGARYHDALDRKNDGTYWQVKTEGTQLYLINYATQRYLTSTGDQQPYVFTDAKVPITITRYDNGTYRLNARSESKSFLCAATQLDNPAAFWEATDSGSEWTIEEAQPYVAPTGVELNYTIANLRVGESLQLEASVTPAEATEKTLRWTSANAGVATVTDGGLVKAVGEGTTTITAVSVADASLKAEAVITVKPNARLLTPKEISADAIYMFRNTGATMGYLVSIADGEEHPTLRDVKTDNGGLCDGARYHEALDWDNLGSYWRLIPLTSTTFYVYNIGLDRYLVSVGNEQPYSFSKDPMPISITSDYNGAFYFLRSGSSAYSYLCASTAEENPARYASYLKDNGCKWGIEVVDAADIFPGATIGTLISRIGDLHQGRGHANDVHWIVSSILQTAR